VNTPWLSEEKLMKASFLENKTRVRKSLFHTPFFSFWVHIFSNDTRTQVVYVSLLKKNWLCIEKKEKLKKEEVIRSSVLEISNSQNSTKI